MMTSLA